MSELPELRARLDAIDRQLIAVVAKRQELVATIKQHKKSQGRHVFDRGREREVLDAAEAQGRSLGVPAPLVRAVMGSLLEASHDLQEDSAPQERAELCRRLLIVGGRGKMGSLFHALLERRGHSVDVLDEGEPFAPARVGRADVTMVAVPMTDAAEVTRALAPLVRPDALLCDINSLKSEVCAALAGSGGEALGMHPMFGPTVSSLRRQKVVVCRVKRGPTSDWLESELGRMGAELVESDPETHDRAMAVVQVLTHFGMMVMGLSLAQSGLSLEETLRFMSPIYRLEVSMVGRLFSQKPELYREILMQNPHGEALRALFVEQAQRLARQVDERDRDAFVARFRETSRYFAEFSREAMALSDHIIESIMSRP